MSIRTCKLVTPRMTAWAIVRTLGFTLGLLAAGATSALAAPPQRSGEGPWAKARVLVMPNAGLSAGELDKIVAEHGGKATRLTSHGLHVVELPDNASESDVAGRLSRHPHLKFAELDKQVKGAGAANDPYFGSAWHLSRLAAPTAWNSSQGLGVTIAIIDTGVDATHADLVPNLVPGWNFVDNNANTGDVHGHGTGVAGAAAASTNNGVGVSAVAGQSKIMPVRIADANAYAYWSTIAQGVTWAADHGARVINISYEQLLLSSTVISAAQYAKSKGALVVVAAGNSGIDEGFTPTTALIAVSATDSGDLLTSWSSRGNYVSIAAPGLNIWSTVRGGGYGAWWGTSVASPVTAGVVALMMSAKPGLSSSQIESLLFSSADDLGAPGRDSMYGYGRVNAAAAVQAAMSVVVPPPDTQAPTVSITSPSASVSVSGVANVAVAANDNVGVSKVELRSNGVLVATDTSAPFSFSWDTRNGANGMSSLVARACDAAGNCADSAAVAVNVANAADLTPPTVSIGSPFNGSRVTGTVSVTAQASDNSGLAGLSLTLYINGARAASSSGTGTLSYSWNTRKVASGTYQLRVDAVDAAGNRSSTSIAVSR